MSDITAPSSEASQTGSKQSTTKSSLNDVKDLGSQLVNAARNGANSLYEDQRDRAAGEIASIGKALEQSAQSLDGTIGKAIAPFAEDAARQVGGLADTLRGRSMAQLGNDLEGFARQWPWVFIAGAVGVGFVAGRFLLSSSSPISETLGGHKAESPKTAAGGVGGPTESVAKRTPAAGSTSGGARAATGAKSGAEDI
ncbi:MAG: hypothetical protein JO001_02505 [Alphaproteobacteria bacterium]|nr:hypothetical protein [Alphaproteobacteria bacterium]